MARTGRGKCSEPPANPARRRLLAATGAGMLAITLSTWPLRGLAAPKRAPDYFLRLSESLTGRDALDPVLAQRFYQALDQRDAQFGARSEQLWHHIAQNPGRSVESIVDALDNKPKLADTLRRIVAAWYTGQVGEGERGQVIAFREALMYDTLGDVIAVPSYCRAGPGYWVSQPPRT